MILCVYCFSFGFCIIFAFWIVAGLCWYLFDLWFDFVGFLLCGFGVDNYSYLVLGGVFVWCLCLLLVTYFFGLRFWCLVIRYCLRLLWYFSLFCWAD